MPRSKATRLRAAAATALLTLTLAAPALAGRGDWDDRHHGDRGYPVHRHDRSCGHDGWRDDRGHYDGGRRGYDRHDDRSHYGRHDRYEHAYNCRPCGRGWRSRDSFHRHLAHHHRIPFRLFPRVIVDTGWGWVFFG